MNGNDNKVETEGFSLEALHAGDSQEFARLVDAYSGKIYRLAIKMFNQQQDAEDVLQETFLKAYRGLNLSTEDQKYRHGFFVSRRMKH